MPFYLYATGIPLFMFLAAVFSDAHNPGQAIDSRVRFSLIVVSGLMWPLLLLGVAQIQALRIRAKLFHPLTAA